MCFMALSPYCQIEIIDHVRLLQWAYHKKQQTNFKCDFYIHLETMLSDVQKSATSQQAGYL